MKKTIFILALASMSSLANAQISAGNLFVSGFGSINTTGGQTETTGGPTTVTTEHDKEFEGMLGLGGGYFLTDQIAAGLTLNFSGSKLTPADTADPIMKSSGFGFGLFGRYYMPITDNFYFNGELGFNMNMMSSEMDDNGTVTEGPKLTMMSIGIRPGFTFFPAPRWALDMQFGFLGFNSMKSVSENPALGTTTTMKSNNPSFGFDLTSVGFGIHYFIIK